MRDLARRCAQVIACFALLALLRLASLSLAAAHRPAAGMTGWRADHHMHLASRELCALVGECLSSNNPPAVFARDAVRALDAAHIPKGVILSCAYLYGLQSLHLKQTDLAEKTRRENEFTAAQVALYPDRLVGFLSVDPLADSAIEEIRHWRGSRVLVGLKLHFTASEVNVRDSAERRRVADVIAAAAAQKLPMVIHLGGGKFNGSDAELFIRDILPSAGSSWIQIAHAGGGLPRENDNHLAVLRAFADHIVRDDPATRRILFDVSYVPAPDETPRTTAALLRQMRRIGMKRFVFGSDFNVLTPVREIEDLEKFGLTETERRTLQENCALWACR